MRVTRDVLEQKLKRAQDANDDEAVRFFQSEIEQGNFVVPDAPTAGPAGQPGVPARPAITPDELKVKLGNAQKAGDQEAVQFFRSELAKIEQPTAAGPNQPTMYQRAPQPGLFDQQAIQDQAADAVQNNPAAAARRKGVMYSAGGETVDTLQNYYMKLPPDARDELAPVLVNRYFNRGKDQNNQHYVDVQYDKDLRTHIFKDPADGKWKPLNDLNLDMEDITDFGKYVVAPALGGFAAGAGGLLTGSPFVAGVAAVGGDAATAGAIRAYDVNQLLEEELIPAGSLSPTREGAAEATWSVAGSAVGGAGGKLGRKLIGGVDDLPGPDLDRKMVNDLLVRFDEEYGDKMPNLTLDQKMVLVAKTAQEKTAAQRVVSRRESLMRDAQVSDEIIERNQENMMLLQDRLNGFMTNVGTKETPATFRDSGLSAKEVAQASENIIRGVEKPVLDRMAAYDQSVTEAYQQANQVVDELLAGSRTPEFMPGDTFNVFQDADKAFRERMTKEYGAIGEQVRGKKAFDIKPVRTQLENLRKRLQQDAKFRRFILGENTSGFTQNPQIRVGGPGGEEDLASQDMAEVMFGDIFTKNTSGILLSSNAKREMAKDTIYDYEAVNSALLQVRQKLRRMNKETADPTTMEAMVKLEDTLRQVRDDGLQSLDPALAQTQTALDKTYRIGKDALDRGLLKRMKDFVVVNGPDGESYYNPTAFDKLFKGDAGAKTVSELKWLESEDILTANPEVPINTLNLQQRVREGLQGKLREMTKTVSEPGRPDTTVLPPEQWDRFKKQYGHALELVFEPGEIAKMKNATSLRNALQSREADLNKIKTEVMDFPWGDRSIANDPTKLFRETWNISRKNQPVDATTLRKNQQLRDLVRKNGDNPDMLNDYRKLIANDIMSATSEGGQIDPRKLNDYLDRNQELLESWYTSSRENKSGMDLVRNLKAYAQMGTKLKESGVLNFNDKNRGLEALNSIARAYVGVFTKAGRVLTAVKQLGGGASAAKERDFILNPRKYLKNQEFYEILNSQEFRALQRGGGHQYMMMLRQEDMEEQAERRQEAGVQPPPLEILLRN